MPITPSFWKNKRVLVTGHTGFKGSWLCLWLQSMGAQVHGLALPPPTQQNLFNTARVSDGMVSTICDLRDLDAVGRCVALAQPEIVLHLAAQSLVRRSYASPVETFDTNVMGTVHLLECARHVVGLRCVVNVTTDKCYENRGGARPYTENEPMGGHDPYSSSKACSELVTAAYRRSFLAHADIALASARAGNVIGGGDWAEDRLVPDVLRALASGEPLLLRYPEATRPWQHVLEPLGGYLCLAERMWQEGNSCAEAFNFGPREGDVRSVRWIVERLAAAWGRPLAWALDAATSPHEAQELHLDSAKAAQRLQWHPRWELETALQRVVEWQAGWLGGTDARELCLAQLADFQNSPIQTTP